MSASRPDHTPFQVLIAGGGVGGFEAVLALRELAGERVATTMVSRATELRYRPMSVREPFGYAKAGRWSVERMADDIGVRLVQDDLKWLEPQNRTVHTASGEALGYDALVLALGARLHAPLKHAVTIDDSRIDEQLHGLIEDVEGGYVNKLAFVIPSPPPWPLPAYELALMTARRAYDMGAELSITLITPEDAPLAVFGAQVSEGVQRVLDKHNILVVTGAYAEMLEPGQITVHPGSRAMFVDRVVALPQLFGPDTPGLPKSAHDGFITVDAHCRAAGVERVYAAGDATDFALKMGTIAAQQADTAAESIAQLAGAPVRPSEFHPEVHAVLLGAEKPLYIYAHITGGHGSDSRISEDPGDAPIEKVDARYLRPYLESHDAQLRA